jgi:hypothetical protein
MGLLQANLYCLGVALLSALVLARLPASRRLVVRYEDLVGDPGATLARLARHLGLDATGVDPAALAVGPIFQGNRVRHRRQLAIEPPGAAPPVRPGPARIVTALLQAPLLLAYGYRRGPRRRPATSSPAPPRPAGAMPVPHQSRFQRSRP